MACRWRSSGPFRRVGSCLGRSSRTQRGARRAPMPTGSEPTWTRSSISQPMAEPSRGLLDTSVVVDHDLIDTDSLPDESAIAAITLAELAAGPHASTDAEERARRQHRLEWGA